MLAVSLRGVLVSVNCGCFSPSRFSHFHCNAMRNTIKAHKNLNTNQQNVGKMFPKILPPVTSEFPVVSLSTSIGAKVADPPCVSSSKDSPEAESSMLMNY